MELGDTSYRIGCKKRLFVNYFLTIIKYNNGCYCILWFADFFELLQGSCRNIFYCDYGPGPVDTTTIAGLMHLSPILYPT